MRPIRFSVLPLASSETFFFQKLSLQVMEELEDKQLLGRLTMVEQENKELREVSHTLVG